jgi:hypothetical protein
MNVPLIGTVPHFAAPNIKICLLPSGAVSNDFPGIPRTQGSARTSLARPTDPAERCVVDPCHARGVGVIA